MTAVLVVVLLPVGAFLLSAAALRAATRRLGPDRPSLSRAVAAAALIWGVNLLVGAVLLVTSTPNTVNVAVTSLIALAAEVAVGWWAVRKLLGTSPARSVVVCLAGLVPVAAAAGVHALVVRPYVASAHLVPSNPMAPTLAGFHRTAPCPHCGRPLVVPVRPAGDLAPGRPEEVDAIGICTGCYRTAEPTGPPGPHLVAPDRFLVDKLAAPRRWDVVTFRHPTRPGDVYAMRLVGLPGEVVFVRDGAAWADGVRLDPPAPLAGLRYEVRPHDSGSPDEPWRLAAEECVVLGDFPARSADSRTWGPVPRANLEGVVVFRFYPPARWGWVR